MGAIWSTFLEMVQAGLFGLTAFYGGSLGSAIVSMSLLVRLALLPLTVRVALRGRAHARRLRALQPRISALRERWKDDPRRTSDAVMAVYRSDGVSPLEPRALGGALVQAPFVLAMFHAVRRAVASPAGGQGYLWITSLARPDALVATLALVVVGLASVAGASEGQPVWTLALPAVISAAMAATLSAGLGLYLVATGIVATLQGLIVRRLDA